MDIFRSYLMDTEEGFERPSIPYPAERVGYTSFHD
jgi:hypothetical protein